MLITGPRALYRSGRACTCDWIADISPDSSHAIGPCLRDFVEQRLRELGITQAAAERRGGLHRGFLGDLLRGQKSGLHIRNTISLARAINVEPLVISALVAGTVGTHGPDIPSTEGVDQNGLSAPINSLNGTLDRTRTNDAPHLVRIELAIGNELKVRAAVTPAFVTAIVGMLVGQAR